MQSDFEKLRKTYDTFIYESFDIEKEDGAIKLTFHFEIPGLTHFDPYTVIKTGGFELFNDHDSSLAHEIVFSLGLVELISYWKSACPYNVIIKCGYLDDTQISWFKKLWYRGLSEFFYKNGIQTDESSFMNVICMGFKRDDKNELINTCGRDLIPVGGGKDSDVTMHLLRDYSKDNILFTVNDQGAREQGAAAAGYDPAKSIMRTYRTIDKNLLELNAKGFLNGHTPFSAIVAFLGFYCAYITGCSYIVLSNEGSASESNIAGTEINHQYSKSLEFENDFRDYVSSYFTPDISYFSLLRPFCELQIAKQFAALPQFHKVFKSCNRGSKQNIWCGQCAKCLFVYIILSPFTEREQLIDIFGSDLFEKKELEGIFDGLCGITPVKPFECVGTLDEINAALCAVTEKMMSSDLKLPYLLEHYKSCREIKHGAADVLLDSFDKNNNVPPKFVNAVTEMYNNVRTDK